MCYSCLTKNTRDLCHIASYRILSTFTFSAFVSYITLGCISLGLITSQHFFVSGFYFSACKVRYVSIRKTIGDDEPIVNSYRSCKLVCDCSQENGTEEETHSVLCLCVKSIRLWNYASGIIMCLHLWLFFVVSILEFRGSLCPPPFAEVRVLFNCTNFF